MSEHKWELEGAPGMYDSLYQCTKCGQFHCESADNPDTWLRNLKEDCTVEEAAPVDVQAQINAALESVAQYFDLSAVKAPDGYIMYDIAAERIRRFGGTNPLALVQARLDHEAQGHAEYRVKCEDLQAKLDAASTKIAKYRSALDRYAPDILDEIDAELTGRDG